MVDTGEVAKEYAAGFAAGIATVVAGHPFDTVKVVELFLMLITYRDDS